MQVIKMNKNLFVLSFGLGVMILAAERTNAQSAPCGDHAAITQDLAATYGETLQSIGLAANNSVIEIFASEAGSWTIAVSTADGRTCLVAAGQAFSHVGEVLPNADPEA